MISAPAYHMNGLFFTTVSLALGYFAVSMPRFEARAYLEAAAEHRCTILSGIPTMFALMARESDLLARLDLTSVKDIVIGSAPLTQALIDRVKAIFPAAAVRNSYGTTRPDQRCSVRIRKASRGRRWRSAIPIRMSSGGWSAAPRPTRACSRPARRQRCPAISTCRR